MGEFWGDSRGQCLGVIIGSIGAGLVAPKAPPQPSEEDLEDSQNLDALRKTYLNRAQLVLLQQESIREEAFVHGIGKLAAHCGATTVAPSWGVYPAIELLLPCRMLS